MSFILALHWSNSDSNSNTRFYKSIFFLRVSYLLCSDSLSLSCNYYACLFSFAKLAFNYIIEALFGSSPVNNLLDDKAWGFLRVNVDFSPLSIIEMLSPIDVVYYDATSAAVTLLWVDLEFLDIKLMFPFIIGRITAFLEML